MIKYLLKKIPINYLKVILALIVIFWLISFGEVFLQVKSDKTLLFTMKLITFKFLNDIWTVLLIGIIYLPIFLLLNIGRKKYGQIVFVIIATLLVLGNLTLVRYSLTTLINLGADILGYSVEDIFKTVSSQESSASLASFSPFLIFPILFLLIHAFFKKKVFDDYLLKIILILFAIILPFNFLVSNVKEDKYQNKVYFLANDIIDYKISKLNNNTYALSSTNEYPLLNSAIKTKDVLSPFFNIPQKKPNIVIVILEGFGSEFLDGNHYSGFTPYLDSLISKSLYWENFLSTTGRTFGVMPSLLGSLPFGDSGFLEIPETPSHISLFSILKENDYTTSYFSGTQSNFDKIINFLEYNKVENIVDENKFEDSYKKTDGDSNGFSWGYPDSELFKKMLNTYNVKQVPRFDVALTLSTHEPFLIPSNNVYKAKVDSLFNNTQNLKITRKDIEASKNIFAALLYTDKSIEDFMKAYQKKDDYKNTIFIFTGDHRLIPIEQKDKLCRFHVPLIIYSPMLKKPQRFKSVSSHLDVAPSLVSFLSNNKFISPIKQTAWLGKGLDTAKNFRNIHQIGLMRYKGGLKDFIVKDYLYSSGDLYKIAPSFNIKKVKIDKVLAKMIDSFNEYKKVNNYVTSQDKIYPPIKNKAQTNKIQLTAEEEKNKKELIKGKSYDEVFLIARQQAFAGKRKMARILCDHILKALPNHADTRMLKGRTLSWDGDYELAEKEFLNTLKREPFYDDPYVALLDLYWWSNQDEKGVIIAKKALKNKIRNPLLSFKLAKAYKRLKQTSYSVKVMDSLLKIYPKNKEYIKFKKTLK
ncbi:LTA synthase family protein [Polaribacter sp. SA4-12]|uniref:LTA synthase family protein n=1 Tax=Polaribacter sp. SA4-12 TaxID=1312072 RepID=UPI000B3BEF0B|nr:LTA synthase family protein [Polaribacter sp. SA4-12]ARV15003.1 sulfatase [Polaribacter sp. SA4-12]